MKALAFVDDIATSNTEIPGGSKKVTTPLSRGSKKVTTPLNRGSKKVMTPFAESKKICPTPLPDNFWSLPNNLLLVSFLKGKRAD